MSFIFSIGLCFKMKTGAYGGILPNPIMPSPPPLLLPTQISIRSSRFLCLSLSFSNLSLFSFPFPTPPLPSFLSCVLAWPASTSQSPLQIVLLVKSAPASEIAAEESKVAYVS